MEKNAYDGGPVSLSYMGSTVEVSDYAEWLKPSYILQQGEDTFYAMVVLGYANDWAETALLKYTPAEGLTAMGQISGQPIDTDSLSSKNIMITSRADCFGTYSTFLPYELTDEGFVP